MNRSTVLVVEDDETLLAVLGEALAHAGYDPVLASGAGAALAILDDAAPDIIVSDIVMPDMDGYALLRAVRARPALAALPFVFLTARGDREDVREGMASGADDYVVKPFEPSELLRAIASRLERRESIEAAQRQARQDWVQTLSVALHHQLRTPLAEVSAYAELLADPEQALGGDELADLVRGLDHGVERLGRLVADFLLLADLGAGRAATDVEARRRPIADWPGLLRRVVDARADAARDRDVRLRLDCPERLPVLDGDETYLADAVGRLVDNAVRFSPTGGEVLVRAWARERDRLLVVSVRDQGRGLDIDDLERLFAPLQRADPERHARQGSGNSLAICRGLVALHGGDVTASNAPGAGTEFRIELPVAGGTPERRA